MIYVHKILPCQNEDDKEANHRDCGWKHSPTHSNKKYDKGEKRDEKAEHREFAGKTKEEISTIDASHGVLRVYSEFTATVEYCYLRTLNLLSLRWLYRATKAPSTTTPMTAVAHPTSTADIAVELTMMNDGPESPKIVTKILRRRMSNQDEYDEESAHPANATSPPPMNNHS